MHPEKKSDSDKNALTHTGRRSFVPNERRFFPRGSCYRLQFRSLTGLSVQVHRQYWKRRSQILIASVYVTLH